MDFNELISYLGPYVATFVICLLSGFVPFINSELYLIGASLLLTKNADLYLALAFLAALGQMLGKIMIYATSKKIYLSSKLNDTKLKKKIDELKIKVEAWGKWNAYIFFQSAFIGIPPFYILSITAGLMRMNLYTFSALGFLGRFARFYLILEFPHLLKKVGLL